MNLLQRLTEMFLGPRTDAPDERSTKRRELDGLSVEVRRTRRRIDQIRREAFEAERRFQGRG